MQMLIVLIIVAGVLASYASSVMQNVTTYHATAEATATGDNMHAYYGFLKLYAAANPAFTGTVSDASVPVPSWFAHGPTVQNYISGGKAYVYNTAPPPGLVGYIADGTIYSLTVGVNTNGTLVGPTTYGQAPVALPSAIPNNSVVVTN
ncbi:type IV pilus biogenesis protein PilM (plasmid) [Paraburkholderia sprentiae WSM5005]|uniref:Type IV pilus biogenesis protein PilM n=1 Tax=Paraburkholderia sprentiae WSM5005 TaxID=754502 RepID=A0ACA8AWX5_9BURK|nr:type IV pilus biogenesis protein PilM [Paraburkholderia sprentiae]APA90228.1 type IV pilus biogenesis protein PilM [Paraburkholderia sprentiae WSM5005]